MPWFLFLFLSIYVAMNSYLFWKVFVVYPQLGKLRLVLAAFLLVMVAGPFLARNLEKWHHETAAKVFGMLIYSWGAMIFWFLFLMAAVDVWNGCVRLAASDAFRAMGFGWPHAKLALLPGRLYLPIIGGVIVLLLGYGLYQCQNVQLRHLNFSTPALRPGETLRLAQITDLHLGEHMNAGRFGRIIDILRAEKPDAILSNGDLVDTSLENLQMEASALASLQPRLGKFAVLGNHEFYNGVDKSLAFHDACGFRMLRAESAMLSEHVRLAGVDDPAGLHTSQDGHVDEDAALEGASPSEFVILLKHQPRVRERSRGRFNLQLSGHTHGGQVFPFQLITRLVYHYYHGLYDLGGGSMLYVNVGAGTWGPPIRLGAQPEVTLITLSHG